MKKELVVATLACAALTGCSTAAAAPERMTTADTCSELKAIFSAPGVGQADDEFNAEFGAKLTELAPRASDLLADDIAFLGDAMSLSEEDRVAKLGSDGQLDKFVAADAKLSATCEL